MTPAFQVKEFLTLSEHTNTKPLAISKIHKVSTKTLFATKFCCRQDNLKELLSFHNVASRAISISNPNSYTKIIGLSGEGGIGKSRLVSEFIQKISIVNRKNVIKINYSDKNNLIFQNDFEALRNIVESKIKSVNKNKVPAVVILEDVHWYEDEEKKKIEKLLFAFSGELPIPFNLTVIFVATYRLTKTQYNFPKFDSFDEIELKPFTEEESTEFINHSTLLKNRKLSKEIRRKVVSLSAGVPFYIEEFLRSLTLEKGKEKIPDSIELLLSYKLSFIDDEVLKTLQIIAAWDGSINKEMLKNLCQKLRIIIQTEKTLLQTGIVRIESKNSEVNYSFTHDIYKNYIVSKIKSCYGIIIHKTIAETFEKFPTKTEYSLFKLYYHYKNSNETEKAFEYLEKYINKNIEQREFELALHRVGELMEYHAKNEKKKLEIWLLKIKFLRELVRKIEMEVELEKIKKKILQHKSSELYLKYLFQLEELCFLSNDFTRAYRIINKGLKLSKLQNCVSMEIEFQFALLRNYNTNGRINESLNEAGKLLQISKEIGNKNYYYWAKYFLANNLQTLRKYAESNEIINVCTAELQNSKDLKLRKNFISLKAKYFYYRNDFKNFVNLLRQLYSIEYREREYHSSILTLLNIADCLIVLNEFVEASEILNNISSYAEKNNSLIFLKRVYEGFMNLYMTDEEFIKSEKVSLQLIKIYDKNDYRNLSIVYSNLIIIYFSLDNLKKAHRSYLNSLYYSKKMNKISDTVVSHYNIGLAYYLSDNFIKGERYIKKSYNLMVRNLGKDFNFEINFTLVELNLVLGKLNKSLKILAEISDYFENTNMTDIKIFYETFYKLLLNSHNQKKFEEFLRSKYFISFIINANVSQANKLKILYYILMLSQNGKIKITSAELKKIVKHNLDIKNKSKNKIILFYLNKLPI